MELVSLGEFHLFELQLHRRRPPEDGNPDRHSPTVEVQLLHIPLKLANGSSSTFTLSPIP
jgi:hypothetical protein